jgi:predicted methyltransferase
MICENQRELVLGYTDILAPVLRDNGQLIAAAGDLNGAYSNKLSGNSKVFDKVRLLQFSPSDDVIMGVDGVADMVLTFRNLHDWLNHSPQELDSVFHAAFNALKPGGIFGVVEHRARPNMDPEQFQNSAPHTRGLRHCALPQERFRAGWRCGNQRQSHR